jgi:hypothetical protein
MQDESINPSLNFIPSVAVTLAFSGGVKTTQHRSITLNLTADLHHKDTVSPDGPKECSDGQDLAGDLKIEQVII